jgi:short-subunit dehydrogenase
MPKTTAVFGAGPGLGAAVARRFGREDHRVALVGRREAPLRALADDLEAAGIDAEAFPADLSDIAAIPDLVTAIRGRFDRIDVAYFAPIGTEGGFIPAAELTADALRPMLELLLLAPVELARAVLPEMIGRGDGAFLVGHGATAVAPQPHISGVGPVMAATRNWLHSLHDELAPRGVYVGTLAIGAMIARSAAHEALTSGAVTIDLPEGIELPIVDPDELADLLWDMTTARDRCEVVHPGDGAFGPASG